SMAAAVEAAEQLKTESATLTKYHHRVNQLIEAQQALTSNGDPAQKLREIDEEIAQISASSAAADSTVKRISADLHKSERVLTNLRSQHEGEVCPTCQRPFTADDTAHVVLVFEREVQTYQEQLQQIRQQIAANTERITVRQAERQAF